MVSFMVEEPFRKRERGRVNIECWYYILSALDLCARPRKIQKYHFLSIGLQGNLEWCGVIRSDTEAPKMPFLTKMTKIPLVNLLTGGRTRSKSSQNNTFYSFSSNLNFSEVFVTLTKFDLVWPEVDSWWAPKILILIRPSERVETNIIVNIIKFSIQRLFMGRNQS